MAYTTSWPVREGNERADLSVLERPEDGTGYVYFLGSFDGTRVKIGWSNKPNLRRLTQHARGDAFGQGGDLTILAIARATRQVEKRVHAAFSQHLVEGLDEVFHAAPLLPYLAWLRDHYFVSTTHEEFGSESGRKVIEPQAWLPGVGRESTRRAELDLLALCNPWDVLPSRVLTGDDWYTPPEYLVCIRAALGGHIDLDPASHVMANQKVRASRFYTVDQRGELQPWSGRVYLNPPFSDWPTFVDKVLAEVAVGHVEAIVCLGATRTLTAQYFEPLLRRADAICIISGRKAFWGLLAASDSPTDGHFLLYIGPDVRMFTTSVSELGATWPKAANG